MGHSKGALSHDCSIENASGTEMGLTIVRDKTGKLQFHRTGDPQLSQQIYAGLPDYAYQPPERGVQIGQFDFRGGFGLEFDSYGASDIYRYRQSFGMDCRFRSGILPGPLPATVTKPGTPDTITVVNGTFETGDTTGWTGLDAASSSEQRTGDYCGAQTKAGSGSETFYQDIVLTANQKGRRFTIIAYAKDSGDIDYFTLSIYDGTNTYSQQISSMTGNYQQLSATFSVPSGATTLRVSCINSYGAGGGVVYWDDFSSTVANGMGTLLCRAEFNGKLYVALGKVFAKQNAGGTGFDAVYEFAYTITSLELFTISGTDYLMIALGAHNPWYMVAAETFSEDEVADNDAVLYKANTSSSGTKIWKAYTPNQLRSAVDPTDAWSGIIYVGDAANDITCLLESEGTLYVMTQRQPFYIDTADNARHLEQSLVSEASSTSGKNACFWQKRLYIPCGTQALYEWDNGTVTNVSPYVFTNNDSDFTGRVMAVAGDGHWLYALIDNGTKVELLAGRWETINDTAFRWHPIAELTLAGVNYAFISTVYAKRLWIGSTSASDSLYYIPLPTEYGNVANDSGLSFQTGGYVTTAQFDANFREDKKAWTNFTAMCRNVDSSNYFTIYYQLWEDSEWTEIGDFGKDGEEITTIALPNDGDGNKPTSEFIWFEIECTSDGSAPAPELLSWNCRGIWYPSQKRKIITMQVYCADNITIRKGVIDKDQTEYDIRTFLDACYNPTTSWPLSFYPPYWQDGDDPVYVKLIDTYDYQLVDKVMPNGETKFEGVVTLTMVEVDLS